MPSEIKLLLSKNDKIIEKIVKETTLEPAQLLKSLQEFRESVNATLTRIIENSGASVNVADDELDEESDDDKADDTQSSPKRRKNI